MFVYYCYALNGPFNLENKIILIFPWYCTCDVWCKIKIVCIIIRHDIAQLSGSQIRPRLNVPMNLHVRSYCWHYSRFGGNHLEIFPQQKVALVRSVYIISSSYSGRFMHHVEWHQIISQWRLFSIPIEKTKRNIFEVERLVNFW